jgi:hypothetical protein
MTVTYKQVKEVWVLSLFDLLPHPMYDHKLSTGWWEF